MSSTWISSRSDATRPVMRPMLVIAGAGPDARSDRPPPRSHSAVTKTRLAQPTGWGASRPHAGVGRRTGTGRGAADDRDVAAGGATVTAPPRLYGAIGRATNLGAGPAVDLGAACALAVNSEGEVSLQGVGAVSRRRAGRRVRTSWR